MIPSKHLHKDDGEEVDYADISLESLGAHAFFGEVNTESVKAASTFILKANILYPKAEEFSIFLNTPGGSCYDAFGLIDLMQVSRIPIRTVGIGSIVSMGVFLLSAGCRGRRVILRNTEVMAHQFTGGADGKFHEVMAAMNSHLQLKKQFYQHFREFSTMTDKQIEEIVFGPSDRWLTPAECKKYGLVDIIVDELPFFEMPEAVPTRPAPSARRGRVPPPARRPAPPPSERSKRPRKK
jgi:ATP-dependent Clp protease, protease subunit